MHAARPHAWKTGLIAGIAFAALALLSLWQRIPCEWVSPLKLQVLAKGTPFVLGDPIVTTGKPGAGDFLFIRYDGDGQARICYDSWGSPPANSKTFHYSGDKPFELELSMPSLLAPSNTEEHLEGRLIVKVNGEEILNQTVNYYTCNEKELWIASNPLEGSSAQKILTGEIHLGSHSLSGNVALPKTSFAHRIRVFLDRPAGQWIGLLGTSILLGWFAALLWTTRPIHSCLATPASRRATLAFFLSAALCLLLFFHVVSYGTHHLLVPENFGVFFDQQARSIMQGRLDVPKFCISDEAFIYEGKSYGYHGITPALLRIPFLSLGLGAAKLSRAFMLLYYAGCLVCVFQILRQVTRRIGGERAEPAAWTVTGITLLAGLGSTLFFLSSRSYIYHEAILCGIAFALASCTFTFAWLETPTRHWWIGALVCGTLSVNARPPTGLFALTLTGTAALWLWLQTARTTGNAGQPLLQRLVSSLRERPAPLFAALLCLPGVLTYNTVSYLKFGTLESCPLRLHVQYRDNPARLEKIGNKQFYTDNIHFNFNGYFTGRHFRWEKQFPFFFAGNPLEDPSLPTNRLDLAEDTVAIPFSMPGLFTLAVVGGACCLILVPTLRPHLAIVWLSVIPMGTALLAAIAISHRYTGDFVPFLLLASIQGLASLDHVIRKARPALLTTVLFLALLSAFLTGALTIEYQGNKVWGVEDQARTNYMQLKQSVNRFLGVKS